jgi:hypothetical protein
MQSSTPGTVCNSWLMAAQVSAINAAMSSLIKTLNVFPRERTIVTRERSKKARDAPC